MKDVTAILLSYKRKPNMRPIIDSLREQSADIEIWVINNWDFEGFGADRLIAIPWNAGEMARYIWVARAETPYVMFQDDDWLIQDETFVEDAIELVDKRPEYMVGVNGRNINWEGSNYYSPEAAPNGGAAILKGHFQCFRKEVAHKVHIMGHPFASDIWWALDQSKGAPSHLVSAKLRRRIKLIDQHDTGLEYRPGHYRERSDVVEEWISRNKDIEPYWWNDGNKPKGKYEYGLHP